MLCGSLFNAQIKLRFRTSTELSFSNTEIKNDAIRQNLPKCCKVSIYQKTTLYLVLP